MPSRALPAPPAPPELRRLSAAEEAAVADEVAPIADAALGAALESLGRSIKARQAPG
jgi:hypothetical protein